MRIDPDSTCGISASADRATVYIEADDSSKTEKEDAAVLLSLAEDNVVGIPYFEVGTDEWKAGPCTRLQTDSSGNMWAVALYGNVPNVLAPSKTLKNATRTLGEIVIIDEKGLLVPTKGSTADIELSTIGQDNLEKWLKNHSNELGGNLYKRFYRTYANTYAARPYGLEYTPNIAGSVIFKDRAWDDAPENMKYYHQTYPRGLWVNMYSKIFPLLPMKVCYRKYSVRAYSSTEKFTDIRYDLADGKYTEKPILDSEYTPPAMYLYDDAETS